MNKWIWMKGKSSPKTKAKMILKEGFGLGKICEGCHNQNGVSCVYPKKWAQLGRYKGSILTHGHLIIWQKLISTTSLHRLLKLYEVLLQGHLPSNCVQNLRLMSLLLVNVVTKDYCFKIPDIIVLSWGFKPPLASASLMLIIYWGMYSQCNTQWFLNKYQFS